MVVLLVVVAFYALGTGFDFFYRFLYVLLLLIGIGFIWAWLNLRGIELSPVFAALFVAFHQFRLRDVAAAFCESIKYAHVRTSP